MVVVVVVVGVAEVDSDPFETCSLLLLLAVTTQEATVRMPNAHTDAQTHTYIRYMHQHAYTHMRTNTHTHTRTHTIKPTHA